MLVVARRDGWIAGVDCCCNKDLCRRQSPATEDGKGSCMPCLRGRSKRPRVLEVGLIRTTDRPVRVFSRAIFRDTTNQNSLIPHSSSLVSSLQSTTMLPSVSAHREPHVSDKEKGASVYSVMSLSLLLSTLTHSQAGLPALYRRSILRALEQLHDTHTRSNIDLVRRYAQELLHDHPWNDILFVQTFKSIQRHGDLLERTGSSAELSPTYKRQRADSLRQQPSKLPEPPPIVLHHAHKEPPARRSEHEKWKIMPKRLYDKTECVFEFNRSYLSSTHTHETLQTFQSHGYALTGIHPTSTTTLGKSESPLGLGLGATPCRPPLVGLVPTNTVDPPSREAFCRK